MHQARLWVYSMLKHSCQPFVPVGFWFSDSAGLMWPRDPAPWLPERDSDRAVGPWRTRLQSGRANCRGLSEICMVRPLYVRECVWIGRLRAVVADVVWLNAAVRRVRRLSFRVSNRSSLALLACGSLWYLLLVTLFYQKPCVSAVWCKYGCGGSPRQHAEREKVRAEGAPITGTLSAFAMDSRQVFDLRANLNKTKRRFYVTRFC